MVLRFAPWECAPGRLKHSNQGPLSIRRGCALSLAVHNRSSGELESSMDGQIYTAAALFSDHQQIRHRHCHMSDGQK